VCLYTIGVYTYTRYAAVVALFNAITKARQAQEEGGAAVASAGEFLIVVFLFFGVFVKGTGVLVIGCVCVVCRVSCVVG
jgi:hypothetical protein